MYIYSNKRYIYGKGSHLREDDEVAAELNNQSRPEKGSPGANLSRSEPNVETEQRTVSRVWGILFFAMLALFSACILIQVFLAGLAIFVEPVYWVRHTMFVRFFELIPILMVVLALIGRLPRRWIWQSVALLFLIFLMYFSANIGSTYPYMAALHPVLAIVMFWVVHKFMIRALGLLRR